MGIYGCYLIIFGLIFFIGFMEKRLLYEGMLGKRGFFWKESKIEAGICHLENV